MIAFIIATKMEADPLLRLLDARCVSLLPFTTYSFSPAGGEPDGVVVISGMGPEKARRATEHVVAEHAPSLVFNVGICGALSDKMEVASVHPVSSVLDGDKLLDSGDVDEVPVSVDRETGLVPATLASVTEPVFEEDRRESLAKYTDIVDMEGYAVAKVCAANSVACRMLKGVSDFADKTGKHDISRNISTISAAVADAVLSSMPELASAPSTMRKVLSFTKVEHTIFSLPLLFAGAWLGRGETPLLRVLLLIAVAGVGARTFGMSMNRILDRDLDAKNIRTAGRELPSGRMAVSLAVAVAIAGLTLYFLACYLLGPVCMKLSLVPIVPLFLYSLLKRFTILCHYGIGVCLGLAPLGAYVAATGGLDFNAAIWLLSAFAFFWISGFDIIYAIQDIDSDRKTGVRSIPAKLGSTGAQIVAAATHTLSVAALVWLWLVLGAGKVAGLALAISVLGFALAYCPRIPLAKRFFPISAIAGIAGAMVAFLGA